MTAPTAICRTCQKPIWNEGGTIGGTTYPEGWSDRIERGGDSLVCFKALNYRHVPATPSLAEQYTASVIAAAKHNRNI